MFGNKKLKLRITELETAIAEANREKELATLAAKKATDVADEALVQIASLRAELSETKAALKKAKAAEKTAKDAAKDKKVVIVKKPTTTKTKAADNK